MADFGASEILPLLLESGAAAAPAAAGVAGATGAAAEAAPLFLGATEAAPAAAAAGSAGALGGADAGSVLGALNPGMAGYAGTMGAMPGGADLASGAGAPFMDTRDWFDRNFGTGTWLDRNLPSKDQVTKALGSLGAAKNALGQKQQQAPVMPSLGAGAGLGKVGGSGLSTVLQLLQQRRQALLSSATAGPGGQARPSGLLGM